MTRHTWLAILLLPALLSAGCSAADPSTPPPPRESKIPADAERVTPATDLFPPILHSDQWEEPVPVPGPVNTGGGEDSPFITPDGNTVYFFFTPDVGVPAQEQLDDGVTGVYVSQRIDGAWSEPERVLLTEPGSLGLDGCATVQGNVMWFCSAREGYTGIHWFTAKHVDGAWTDWQVADFDPEYEVGELHLTADGDEIYFDSGRAASIGGRDIWILRMVDGEWQTPENVTVVNSKEDDIRPFVSQDGSELWFTRQVLGYPAVFVSRRSGGEWQVPELIISQFAAEPSVDAEGNVYFAHHFFRDGTMIEADIYVARRKR